MLHTIDRPMQLIHADIADLHFFSKSSVAPKYCLVCVNLFTLKTYTYGMKIIRMLTICQVRKILFQQESLREYLKGENIHQIRLQTDQEFNQNEIVRINKKYNVLHHNSKLNDRHDVGAKQKIGVLKFRVRDFK